jgi:hypothetical protein
MEDGEARMSSSCENVVLRSGHDSSASQNQSGNYRQKASAQEYLVYTLQRKFTL